MTKKKIGQIVGVGAAILLISGGTLLCFESYGN